MAKRGTHRVTRSLLAAIALTASLMPVRAEDLTLYGAGSLREAMTELAGTFARAHGVTIRTEFGASGRMRERIERGEAVDIFTSADVGHPRKLVADGRAEVMAMFARNRLCLLAPSRSGISTESVVETLLRSDLRVGVSPAKIDPLGDYTVELFRLVARQHPDTQPSLEQRAVVLDNPPGAPPARSGDYVLDALLDGRVGAAVVYCAGRDRYAKLSRAVSMVSLPASLQVGSEYGLAVMKGGRPDARLLALGILSPEGQALLAKHGFTPVTAPAIP